MGTMVESPFEGITSYRCGRLRGRPVQVTWPDGRVQHSVSAAQFLRDLRHEQWFHLNVWEFRRELVHRTEVWTGHRVSPMGPARRFVQALADAGLFKLDTV